MRGIRKRIHQKIQKIRQKATQTIGQSRIYQKIGEWLSSIQDKANQGTYGRLLFDGGVAVSLSSAVSASLSIWTGFFECSLIKRTFDGADGVALFAAILLLPTGFTVVGGIKVVMTGLKWAFNVKELERGREEGERIGQERGERLAIRADLLRRDGESLSDAMERVRRQEEQS